MSRQSNWDKERAYALWRNGLTGGQIAERLGVTRNAVMGALHRAGLTGDPKVRPKKPKMPPREPRKIRPKKPIPLPPAPPVVALRVYRNEDMYAVIESPDNGPRLSITDLTRNQCRFPISPDFCDKDSHYFCGRLCASGDVYCAEHSKVTRRSRETRERVNKTIEYILLKTS